MDTQVDSPDMINVLANRLLAKRDEAIKARSASGIEKQWLEDERMFDSSGDLGMADVTDYATGEAFIRAKSSEPRRSRVVVNIIRGKCEQTEGRFSDIQLPVDDKNWGLKITPVPDIEAQKEDKTPVATGGEPVVQDGKPVTLADLARNEISLAVEKMKLMEKEIEDQLNECSFNGECRKVARDAIAYGTGILKGPAVISRLRKSWKKSETEKAYVLEVTEEQKPYSKRVDRWNIYPDPDCGDDIKKASYIWEKDGILPRELRRLMGVDGYLADQIEQILKEDPIRTFVVSGKQKLQIEKTSQDQGSKYELWEYNGDLTVDELKALDCDCGDMNGMVSACVVFVNEKPIKASLNLLDTGDLPYDFFQWSQVPGSIWGIGLVRIMSHISRIITAAWRMMMDNAGDSAGANIVIGEGIFPDDGRWEVGGKKIWRFNGDMVDVRQAFTQFQLTNNQADLQRIIELALRFADMETMLPMAFAGEQVGPAETLGAVELKVDSSNVGLRGRVKLWDDQITRRHLTRYYHWNMQYNQNDEIKGDYNVDPRGVSYLLQKDKAAQTIMQILPLLDVNPTLKLMVDPKKALKAAFAAQQIDILREDEDIENLERQSQEQPPQDPRIAAGAELAKAKMAAEEKKLAVTQEMADLTHEIKMEEAQRDREHELQLAAINRETKMLELSIKSGDSLEKIKADLAKKSMELDVQQRLSKPGSSAKQVSEPPTEPIQRAPDGRAYQE